MGYATLRVYFIAFRMATFTMFCMSAPEKPEVYLAR
jgi:hypothetical protein